jgi:hypothetical protein
MRIEFLAALKKFALSNRFVAALNEFDGQRDTQTL